VSHGQYDLAYRSLFLRIEASVSDGDALERLEHEIRGSVILAPGRRDELLDRAGRYRIDHERSERDRHS
jgi:hypothetical protein